MSSITLPQTLAYSDGSGESRWPWRMARRMIRRST